MESKSVPNRVLRIPMNLHGRDFVIGDVHGAYDLVLKGLKATGFDASKDRLFSAGDLVDRGLESARVLKFLSYPGLCAAVRGNHEDNLLQIYADGEPDEDVLRVYARMFGMEWLLATSRVDRQAILAKFEGLPVAIEIQTARGTVGIVHGDVPKGMSWPTFLERLEAGDKAVRQIALEGRDRIQSGDTSGVAGVGRVIVGHTVQENGPQRFGNVFAIDTGAIFNLQYGRENNALTMANLTFQTGILAAKAAESNAAMPGLFIIDAPASDEEPKPFGQYGT